MVRPDQQQQLINHAMSVLHNIYGTTFNPIDVQVASLPPSLNQPKEMVRQQIIQSDSARERGTTSTDNPDCPGEYCVDSTTLTAIEYLEDITRKRYLEEILGTKTPRLTDMSDLTDRLSISLPPSNFAILDRNGSSATQLGANLRVTIINGQTLLPDGSLTISGVFQPPLEGDTLTRAQEFLTWTTPNDHVRNLKMLRDTRIPDTEQEADFTPNPRNGIINIRGYLDRR